MIIEENNSRKTAISIKYSNLEYYNMFCIYFTTLAGFLEYINKRFKEKHYIFVIIYLDNVLIYTKTFDQLYIKAVCLVLDQL